MKSKASPTSTRYYSSIQEHNVAKALNGKTVSGSGAPKFCAGDVLTDEFLIECKTSMKPKDSFSIKKEFITKNEIERVEVRRRYSAVAISFEPEGTENYYIINEKTMKKFLELLREEDEE